jgi:hypothetical protein
VELSVVAVAVPVPGTEGPDSPPPLTEPVPPPVVAPPGSFPIGRLGSCTPPELLPPPLLLPPLLLPPEEEPPVGRGTFGSLGSGTETAPPEPLPDGRVGFGTTEVTVFLTQAPFLRISPTGHSVRPVAEPAETTPLSESASAPAVTKPARRTVVLGDIREKPPRRIWGDDLVLGLRAGPKA